MGVITYRTVLLVERIDAFRRFDIGPQMYFLEIIYLNGAGNNILVPIDTFSSILTDTTCRRKDHQQT